MSNQTTPCTSSSNESLDGFAANQMLFSSIVIGSIFASAENRTEEFKKKANDALENQK